MHLLARLLIRIFFRRVELQHGDRLPQGVPVVLVANHLNGLVDGLLLMATLGRYPRFLGKSTLFKIPPLWPFLKLAGVIPVHRAIDGAAGDANRSAFATSRALLARNGLVAVFPEGISHNEVTLQPLRTGAARIALEAAADGATALVTVAVGLTYDAKARFRSRALVRVAEPVAIEPWVAAYRLDPQETVRRLTDDVARQLADVSPPYESWAQAEGLARMAEVVVRQPLDGLPKDVDLADQVAVTEQLARQDGQPSIPMSELRLAFAAYERDLTLLGISDGQLAADYPRARLRLSLAWSVLKVVASLPFAAVGVVVHVVPFQLMKQLAKKPTNEGIQATVKLLGCFVLFTLVYAALGYGVGRSFGAGWGALTALGAPLCGYLAVRLAERVKRLGGVLEGYRIVRDRRAVLGTVKDRRLQVVRAAYAVLGWT
jgi:1-acyl-sn-glycerol-3-phosphate acyltransferase